MLQGPYSSLDRPLIHLPFRSFIVAMVLLPLTGFIGCVFISVFYHYEDSTYTHCKVKNYLPSISSAIGRTPESYIWRCCIGLHSAPRYLVTFAYLNFYRSRFINRTPELLLSAAAFLCSLAENTGLLLLTYVSSTDNYGVHEKAFKTFIVSSLIHMIVTCRLWYVIKKNYVSSEEVKSWRWKLRLFLFNVACCGVSYYLFWRHNHFCEPGGQTRSLLYIYTLQRHS
ncbi:post-GPI attachment to proteins factor 2-like isoform 2-T4 [Pholidichthys leucotaenia]